MALAGERGDKGLVAIPTCQKEMEDEQGVDVCRVDDVPQLQRGVDAAAVQLYLTFS